MLWLAIVLTSIYLFMVVLLLFHWRRITPLDHHGINSNFLTSILIPVRNEEQKIVRLIESILRNNVPEGLLEILVINDHSDDSTSELVQHLMNKHSHIKLLSLPNNRHGKKAALSYGVERARGKLILCTDGDCEVGQAWVAQHQMAYLQGSKLTFGPVSLLNKENSRVVDVINLEQQALVAMGAATAKMGKPSMINGCNYSFPKDSFEEVNGFEGNEHIPTGDDEFLLRKIHRIYPGQIQFLKSSDATVLTEPVKSVAQFYHQRKRWASKWRFHKDTYSKIIPSFLFLCYLSWSLLLIDSLNNKSINLESLDLDTFFTIHISFFILLTAKVLADLLFLLSISKSLKQTFSLRSFIMLQIIYPIYVVFFGLASNFGKYRWRERTYNI